MVVTSSDRARSRTAIVLPDEAAWLVWGHDLAAVGIDRVASPERADVLLTPARVPDALLPAIREAWDRMGPTRAHEVLAAPTAGSSVADALHGAEDEPGGHGSHEAHGHGTHAGHDEHAGHDMHGGHDEHAGHDMHSGHDMMAIVGDPSADGLVMEDIAFTLGPLAPSLPGGLVVDLSLDGDVVAAAAVRATLAADAADPAAGVLPDPLAVHAWQAAFAASDPVRSDPVRSLTSVELERALSHAAWLRTLASALGWAQLGDAALALARALLAVRRAAEGRAATRGLGEPLDAASLRLADVRKLVASRRFGRRLSDDGRLDPDELLRRGVGGPVARAAGIETDARDGDERYRLLGFERQVARDGDAAARARVRTQEIGESLRLVAAVVANPARIESAAVAPIVEGPRGPLRVDDHGGGAHASAPGARELTELAGAAMLDLELASATAVLVSFDLSPWRVGA